jgi:hypothetical protein
MAYISILWIIKSKFMDDLAYPVCGCTFSGYAFGIVAVLLKRAGERSQADDVADDLLFAL